MNKLIILILICLLAGCNYVYESKGIVRGIRKYKTNFCVATVEVKSVNFSKSTEFNFICNCDSTRVRDTIKLVNYGK